MAGELFSVFGWERAKELFYSQKKLPYTNLDSGTEAWSVAFEMTYNKPGMGWLWKYYEDLPWHESDIFDGIIEQRIGERFINNSPDQAADYYAYLENRFRSKDDLSGLRGIAEAFNGIYEDAYRLYRPMTEDICSRTASLAEVEHLLDWMLGYIEDDRMEMLYHQICDRYKPLYPDSISTYERYVDEIFDERISEDD